MGDTMRAPDDAVNRPRRAPMRPVIGTPTKLFIEIVAALLVMVTLGCGFLVWRLEQSPLSVDFLAPYVEKALSDPDRGRFVSIDDAILIWEARDHSLAVRAVNAAVTGPDGTLHALAPELTLRFGLAALLRGRIEVVDIAVLRPDLRLVREADGRWQFGFGVAEQPAPGASADGGPASDDDPLAALLDSPPSEGPTASLRSVRIVAADLVVDDRLKGRTWRAPRVSLALSRLADGIGLDGSFDLELRGGTTHADLTARYDRRRGWMTGSITLDRLDMAEVARLAPKVEGLGALAFVASGTVQFTVMRDGTPVTVAADLAGRPGRILHADLPDGAVEIGGLALRARYVAEGEQVAIEKAELKLGGATLTVTGSATSLTTAVRVEGEVRLVEMPVDELHRYWPARIAPNPRKWVMTNLSRGTAREAVARAAIGRNAAGAPWEVEKLQGSMRYDGLRVNYFGQLPPVDQVAGTAEFDNRSFNLAITGGVLRGTRVEEAKVAITGLDLGYERIAIDLAMRGPLADALYVIDQQPLGYMRRFGIQQQGIAGDAASRLAFRFPLIAKLPIEKVELAAAANIRGARVPKVVRGLDLSDGDFALTLDGSGLDLTGRGRLAGVPMAATWTENFLEAAPFRRRFDVSGTVNGAQRRALGVDVFEEWVEGASNVTVDYTEIDGRRASLSGTADLAAAKISMPEIVFEKPAGTQAAARFELALADGKFVRLVQAELDGRDIAFRGNGSFGPDGKLRRLDFDRLSYSGNEVAGSVTWEGRDLTVDVTGRSADLTELLARDETASPAAGQAAPAGPKLTITAKLDRVTLKPGQQLAAVTARAVNDGRFWRSGTLDARVGSAPIRAVLTPYERGRELTASTEDAGTVLRELGITEYMLGGKLRFGLKFLDTMPAERALGRLEIDDYRLIKAPVLASVLAVASITGIPELLSGEGIAFSSLVAEGVRTADTIEVTDARAAGLAIGMTLRGTIRRSDEVVNLTGTIVPIYGINRVIGSIPLIGDLLTGGPGGGLFAFTYAVRGPLSQPSISVNPLSALAPGFLRNLFFERGGNATPMTDSQAVPPTSANDPARARE